MIDFLFNPNGRISRKGYLLGYLLPMLAVTFAANYLGPLALLVGLFYLWPSNVSVPIRRFHDMGATGWYHAGVVLLVIVAVGYGFGGIIENVNSFPGGAEAMLALPEAEQEAWLMEAIMASDQAKLGFGLAMFVSFAEIILFLAVKGTTGENRYGGDPLADGRGFAD